LEKQILQDHFTVSQIQRVHYESSWCNDLLRSLLKWFHLLTAQWQNDVWIDWKKLVNLYLVQRKTVFCKQSAIFSEIGVRVRFKPIGLALSILSLKFIDPEPNFIIFGRRNLARYWSESYILENCIWENLFISFVDDRNKRNYILKY